MKITPEFWNFIEKYLPNYYHRDDVLTQSQLQLYIDGHKPELSENISKDEAEDELHHLLYNIYREAIEAYSKGEGTECEVCKTYIHFTYCPKCGKKLN